MLCSEKELGLAQDSDGIMILSPDCEPGQPVFEVLGLKDVRYELGLTPNRPDCLSVLGVAREVSAMCGRSLNVNLPPLSEGDEWTPGAYFGIPLMLQRIARGSRSTDLRY
mgnify:CR=1 FL=1